MEMSFISAATKKEVLDVGAANEEPGQNLHLWSALQCRRCLGKSALFSIYQLPPPQSCIFYSSTLIFQACSSQRVTKNLLSVIQKAEVFLFLLQ